MPYLKMPGGKEAHPQGAKTVGVLEMINFKGFLLSHPNSAIHPQNVVYNSITLANDVLTFIKEGIKSQRPQKNKCKLLKYYGF